MTRRVLWVTKGLGLGGAERLLVLTASNLDRDRYAIDVAYLLPWKNAFVTDLKDRGVRTICLDARRTAEPGWPLRLRRLLVTGKYAIVHTHSPVPAAAARLFVKPPTRLVHTEHNVWDRYRWPTRTINALTYHRNHAVLAVSAGVATSISPPTWMPSGPLVEVLRHGVDLEQLRTGEQARRAARQLLEIPSDVPVLGTVANLTPKKDHEGIIEAVGRVRDKYPEVLALFIGSGPLESHLRDLTERRGLAANIRFLGMRSDALALLPALDVFVLGSRYEGLPISLLEAMGSGIACVSTRVGGVEEVVRSEREGILVPPREPAALAEAVVCLLDDPAQRSQIAAAGAERVRRAFSIERAAQRIVEVYDGVAE
jgi:glycosyltransferase involved in cell wall biosynthesis